MANPAELLVAGNPGRKRKRRNPGAGEQATELYEQFHGAPSQHIDDYSEPLPLPGTLAELGDLIELRVKCKAGWKLRSLDFAGTGIKLAGTPGGSQLYLVGGDQRLRSFAAFDADRSKDLIDLGEATYIAYRTRKAHVDNKMATYEHEFGEETGVAPRLMYDKRTKEPRLFFVGGQYHIEGVGIVN